MWVVFLASALAFAIAALVVAILIHRVCLMMRRDEWKLENEMKKENEEDE